MLCIIFQLVHFVVHFLGISQTAWAKPQTALELQRWIAENYSPRPPDWPSLGPTREDDRGDLRFFAPVEWLAPGQLNYSPTKTLEKVEKLIKRGPLDDPLLGELDILAFSPLKKALPAIGLKDRIILFDGHHRVMAALAMGATHVPVRIKKSLLQTDLELEDVYKLLLESHLIWPFNSHDKGPQPLPRFFDELRPEALIDWVSAHSLTLNGLFNEDEKHPLLELEEKNWTLRPLGLRIKPIPYPQLMKAFLLRHRGFEAVVGTGAINEAAHNEMIEEAQRLLEEELKKHPALKKGPLPPKLILPDPLRQSNPQMDDLKAWMRSTETRRLCHKLLTKIVAL